MGRPVGQTTAVSLMPSADRATFGAGAEGAPSAGDSLTSQATLVIPQTGPIMQCPECPRHLDKIDKLSARMASLQDECKVQRDQRA